MAKREYFKIFIDAVDVTKLHGCSKTRAYERLRKIFSHYKLQPYQRVNIFQFCEYEGIPLERMIALMKETSIIPAS
ncbi:MAG TPA: hypothetical protein VGD22_06265 [Sphingobacteriaceae bacterium]